MPKRSSKPHDLNAMAAAIVGQATDPDDEGGPSPAQADTFSIVLSQQHVGLLVPGQSVGAALVTVSSQPHDSSGQR
jgi:hypothetical protein